MKLLSLSISPSHSQGWSSRELTFGTHLTQLFGPNGCGKTPVIQAIAFALGYPVTFREDVKQNCGVVHLCVEVDGTHLRLSRYMNERFRVEARGDGEPLLFFNESDYSRFIFGLWGQADPSLTTSDNKESKLYLAHVLPLFYLDQDHGYSRQYHAPNQFLKSQYSEVMRVLFGISPRNPYGRRQIEANLRDDIEAVDRRIVRSQKIFEDLLLDVGGERRDRELIDRELADAARSIEALTRGADAHDEVLTAFDKQVREIGVKSMALERERDELRSRVSGLSRIANDIEVEANTLSLNEEARRLFASFQSICANASCGLFISSADSYGKSLLYLRDQLKDIERLKRSHEVRVGDIDVALQRLMVDRAAIEEAKRETGELSKVGALVEAASRTIERVLALKRERKVVEELDDKEEEYISLLAKRNELLDTQASMNAAPGAADLRLLEVRKRLEDRIAHWLDVLKTVNVSREIVVDADFSVTFGKEKIGVFKGSTLTRIVLAIRAAVFEALVKRPGFSPRFLILDTPRQQDILREHLASYISALKSLAMEHDVQVVFSGSNYHYENGVGDVEWVPSFPGKDHEMFLGLA